MRLLFSMIGVFVLGFSVTAQDKTATTHYNEGLTALKAKDYETALTSFDKALEMADPEADEKVVKLAKKNCAIACYSQGNAQLKAGELDAAMATYEKGLEANPEYFKNIYGTGKVYNKKKMYKETAEAYVKAGQMAKEGGKEEQGDKYISQAAKKVGSAYAAKDYDLAIAVGTMMAEYTETAEMSYYMAKSYLKKNDGANAVAHAEKAAELGGDEGEGKYLFAHAEALELSGNKSAAAAAYKKVPAGKYYDSAQYKAGQL